MFCERNSFELVRVCTVLPRGPLANLGGTIEADDASLLVMGPSVAATAGETKSEPSDALDHDDSLVLAIRESGQEPLHLEIQELMQESGWLFSLVQFSTEVLSQSGKPIKYMVFSVT